MRSNRLYPDGASSQRGIVDNALYVDGHRIASPASLAETYQTLRAHPGAIAWIGLYRPSTQELESLANEFGLHELAVEDAIQAHQRPKLERYSDMLFIVLRAARYIDAEESLEFGELHLFVGSNFIISLRHSESPDLSPVRHALEARPEFLAQGPQAILYAILDAVVDAYAPVVEELAKDIDEIETEVFGGDSELSRRIYGLTRETISFQRASEPLTQIVASLATNFARIGEAEELQKRLRDVADHVSHVNERVDSYRQLLRDILTVNGTLVAQRQNEDMKRLSEASNRQNEEVKKISAWAAILFAPTLVGTVYGMNFRYMPELDWDYGYPLSIGLMVTVSITLFIVFRRRGWI